MANPAMKWVGSKSGSNPRVIPRSEGTSETFAIGDLVIQDESENGVVGLANTSGVPDAQTFLGIALRAASGTAGTVIPVLIPDPDDYFSAVLASAEGTLVAPDQDHVGDLAGLILMNSANDSVYAVDTGNTNWVKIIEVHRQDIATRGGDPGDATTPTMSTGDRVVFRFLGAVIDSDASQA
jgi:hypothetical protein